MSRKTEICYRASRQAQYRETQRRAGIPTGEVVAMSTLRCTIAHLLLQRKEAAVWALSDLVERELLTRHYARTLTAQGIETRFSALVEEVRRDLPEYGRRLGYTR